MFAQCVLDECQTSYSAALLELGSSSAFIWGPRQPAKTLELEASAIHLRIVTSTLLQLIEAVQ